MATKRVDQSQQKGLTQYLPTDLQRDYPHIARGSYGIVFKACTLVYLLIGTQGTCKGITGTVVIKDLEVRNQQSIDDWKKELMVMRYTLIKILVWPLQSQYCKSLCCESFWLLLRWQHSYNCHGIHASGYVIYIDHNQAHIWIGDLFGVLHKNPEKHPISLVRHYDNQLLTFSVAEDENGKALRSGTCLFTW